MHINIEFLDEDPIENVITCLNYYMDKVIFFGYKETYDRVWASTRDFLKKYCGLKTVDFVETSRDDLTETVNILRDRIDKELSDEKNKVYLDITGGGSLILVACGILASEMKLPLHLYDVETEKLSEYNTNEENAMSRCVPERKLHLSLDSYVAMYGAKINREIGKAYKSDKSSEFRQIITNVFKMTKKYQDEWSVFSAFLKSCFDAAPSGRVNVNMTSVKESLGLKQFRALGRDEDNLKRLLTELAQTGAIAQLEMNETRISFRYHSEHVADVLFDTGSPLELYTYFSEADTANDCINGAYIDWDGEIHSSMGDDVLNEIDVFKLNGCIPTFISCKSGRLDGPKAQHALYELETVAERFGGGHARKVLVVTHELGRIYKARAVQMGIEIREV